MSKKIVFMGTPDFAVASLKQLIAADVEVAAVITSPDRPAGRGQQVRQSAVKTYALSQNLPVLQPEKLKNEAFLAELKMINADLFVVVAFRMLPEVVWDMPELGTINLHGSLLPQYRGAAPINWAVINGETETGATTFFIEKEIDTGNIIDKVVIPIAPDDTAGTVHDELMERGGELLTKTVMEIFDGTVTAQPQAALIDSEPLKHAPKIFKADCQINWTGSAETIHNKIRGLSPYPTAWTALTDKNGKVKTLKLFKSKPEITGTNETGKIKVEDQTLKLGASDGWIEITALQLEGKRRMNTSDFIKGFSFDDYTLVIEPTA